MKTQDIKVVAVDHSYDESMGAYIVAYLWDGEKVTMEGGIYQNTDYTTVTATLEEKRQASIWLEANTEESGNYNKYARCNTYLGCIVTLKRSRKAPNKKPLKVVDFHDRYFSQSFGTWVDEKVTVLDEETNTEYTVSYGCVDALVKGIQDFPFWYVSEGQYNEVMRASIEAEKEEQENIKLAKDYIENSGDKLIDHILNSDIPEALVSYYAKKAGDNAVKLGNLNNSVGDVVVKLLLEQLTKEEEQEETKFHNPWSNHEGFTDLGTFTDSNENYFELYSIRVDKDTLHIGARYGSDGDYISGGVYFGKPSLLSSEPMKEAYKRHLASDQSSSFQSNTVKSKEDYQYSEQKRKEWIKEYKKEC